MKINPKSLFLILNLWQSPKISRFSTKNGQFEDSTDFRDNFLTISVAPFQSQTTFIPREWYKFWKTTKCEKKDLSRKILNLNKTSRDRILALNLTLFDPLTLRNQPKSYLNLSALEIMSFRKIEKSWFGPFIFV